MLNKLYCVYILQAVYKRIIFQVHTLDLKCDIGQCSKGNVHGGRGVNSQYRALQLWISTGDPGLAQLRRLN
jgi:hypothetical protein